MFWRSRRGRLIDPGSWPQGRGRRVLIEHSDGGELFAQATVLREAGYRVATCKGPTGADGWPKGAAGEWLRCPLIETGRCALVAGADVVVCDCGVGQCETLVPALAASGKRVVFEAAAPRLDRHAAVPESVQLLAFPVTERALLNAVSEAWGPGR